MKDRSTRLVDGMKANVGKTIHYGWFDDTDSIMCGVDAFKTNSRYIKMVNCKDCLKLYRKMKKK